MGRSKSSKTVYVIDFGLTKRYKDLRTNQHIPYYGGKSLTGTARYASINTHLGSEQSRRDDLEGILYVLLYFLRGSLPWQGLPAQTKEEKYKKIMDEKIASTPEILCKNLPVQLQELVRYCRGLNFEEEPNYEYVRKLLREIAESSKFEFDNIFDWMIIKPVPEDDKKKEEIPIKSIEEHKLTKQSNVLALTNKVSTQLTLKPARIT